MFEKCNPLHPDKLADRIGGALVDIAYAEKENPKVAGEVLIGHKNCHIIIETDVNYDYEKVCEVVKRIAETDDIKVDLQVVPQDEHLAKNQENEVRCGDNGIFKGVPMSIEEENLIDIARGIYKDFKSDGKYIQDMQSETFIVCQSYTAEKMEQIKSKYHVDNFEEYVKEEFMTCYNLKCNPLGEWTGGTDVDTGATNRKLGSDMGNSITGGGLHFKDLSKADVSVNIYCFLQAQRLKREVKAMCSIGDTNVYVEIGETNYMIPFKEVVAVAKNYIDGLGGFEKFAEWGLIR